MLKPYTNLDGIMFGLKFEKDGEYGDQIDIVQVSDERDALKIITEQHKQWCPHCRAKRCTHRSLPFDTHYHIKGKDHWLQLCFCSKNQEYFLNDRFRHDDPYDNPLRQKLNCRDCHSDKIILKPEVRFDPIESTIGVTSRELEEGFARSIYIDTLICKNCVYKTVVIYQLMDDGTYNIINGYDDLFEIDNPTLLDSYYSIYISVLSRKYAMKIINKNSPLIERRRQIERRLEEIKASSIG